MVLFAGVAASQPAPEHKVTICHATNSDTNQYVQITVDVASTGHLQGGHDTQHEGGIWNADMKANQEKWGDIIPPYTYGDFSYAGQNWTDAGIEIYGNDCAIPADETPAETPTPTPSATPAETQSGEVGGETGAPSNDPSGGVEGVIGTPNATLPPTDSISGPASTAPANGTLRLVLIAMAGILGAMLLVGREPAARRR